MRPRVKASGRAAGSTRKAGDSKFRCSLSMTVCAHWPVKMCLVKLPQGCPPGDSRGGFYQVTDLRTQTSWTEADSSHSCGGLRRAPLTTPKRGEGRHCLDGRPAYCGGVGGSAQV